MAMKTNPGAGFKIVLLGQSKTYCKPNSIIVEHSLYNVIMGFSECARTMLN